MEGFRRNLCGKVPYKDGTKVDLIIKTDFKIKPEDFIDVYGLVCESFQQIQSGKYFGDLLVIGATISKNSVRVNVGKYLFTLYDYTGDILAYRKHKPDVLPKPRYYTSWNGEYIAVSFDGVMAAPFGLYSRDVSFEKAEFIMQGVVADTPNQTILNDRWSTVNLKTSELFFKEILP